ncbi:hypothetical protein KSD_37860 [Ktedonobacter sp. SOSP1-85]|uniref:winged helix-turn-helix domain-containing protein n=1 Tax=Ktedonobacter sp. SOSP1-85 TaxID=2778367 RepID=UPI001915CAD7|nr:winged helix-turn-helix domain-containing protein [Ktedonobacter sp. SOSP1-85]GHO76015.1 hypothetical protein KSD_37860 [Ktedonobacter sp. SOSP1-85]
MDNKPERPLQFRWQDAENVMNALRAGNSCALLGMDGVGKSRFMQHLATPSVLEHYLGEKSKHMHCLLLSAHELTSISALACYRRMALLLNEVMRRYDLPPAEENPLLLTNEDIASTLLLQRVEQLMQQDEQLTLVYFFDELDSVYTQVEPQFLRFLQALRYRAQGRVCYVLASNNPPKLLGETRTRKQMSDAFSELVNGRVLGVRPLEREDAYLLIERGLPAALHEGFPLPLVSLQRLLFEVTGGHHGLLRTTLLLLEQGQVALQERESITTLSEKLLRNGTINSKCEQLWESLSEPEQQCLKQLQKGQLVKATVSQQLTNRQVNDLFAWLQLKGVLAESSRSKTYRCFSPLLAAYISQQFSAASPGLQIDFTRYRCWIDGVLQPDYLRPHELRLLRYLADHAGEVCSRRDTTSAVYNEAYSSATDDARLDALVERTRRHMGDDPRAPRFLITVRGAGHQLNEYLSRDPQIDRGNIS